MLGTGDFFGEESAAVKWSLPLYLMKPSSGQQKSAGQPFLAGVKELFDQLLVSFLRLQLP
jgi:hypothetical protein